MTLTSDDVKRINSLGYSKEDYLVRVTAGFCELKNVDGYCFFYDSDSMICRIYEARPEGCRWYPVIYDARKRKSIVDDECPAAASVTRDRIRKVNHKVRTLVETLRQEAAHGERPC
jgi:Fe-S-cluster containining protein